MVLARKLEFADGIALKQDFNLYKKKQLRQHGKLLNLFNDIA